MLVKPAAAMTVKWDKGSPASQISTNQTTMKRIDMPRSGSMKISKNIRVLRDPTRGGVATVLNEIALRSKIAINVQEEKIPIREGVKVACEMLGIDPLYVANEGKLVAVVAPEDTPSVIECMRNHKYGRNSDVIGTIALEPNGMVILDTIAGGQRIVDMLVGEQLPRIC